LHDVLDPKEMLASELVQRRESGFDIGDVEEQVQEAINNGSPSEMERAHQALEETQLRDDWDYVEPSSFDEIKVTLVATSEAPPLQMDEVSLHDRVLAAWLGRCAGCNLGKPVEGWTRERIRRYLELADAYPITDYFPVLDPAPSDLALNGTWVDTTRGNVKFMARDDDIDYTIIGLHVLEQHGFAFGPMEVALEWLDHLPFTQVYTAERAAYRNLLRGMNAPDTATFRNPYREWIGAQIRADIWGYVSPGDPQRAADLAFRDASLSHTQNGIYGEQWAAALIAASFGAEDVRQAIDISLSYVPPRSRLAESIRNTVALYESGVDWEQARDAMEREYYANYSFVHTVNNACVVTAALLWGDGNFTKTIGFAVQGGWDTDCTGATSGSVFGAMHGTDALPRHWVEPLNDLVRSAIMGYDHSKMSDLAARTVRMAQQANDAKFD
jgi:ADP-ribosylglycohydrolase